MSFVSDAAQLLLACYETELESAPNPPATICMRVGSEVPYSAGLSEDECCSGLAWVRVVRIYPSINFPSPADGPEICIQTSYAVELELGAARCHSFGTTAAGPSCDTWTAEFLQVDADAAAMRRAVLCCFAPQMEGLWGSDQFVMGEWVPFGAEGGCIGGTMSVTVQLECSECD